MSTQSEALKERSMLFAIDILGLVDRLPHTPTSKVVAHQIARSGTSVAFNYRAACNGRSRAEFIAKLATVVEEADETVGWLELIRRRRMRPETEVLALLKEALELRAIFGKSLGTARANIRTQMTR